MSKFSHAAADTRPMTIPCCFFVNSQAKKQKNKPEMSDDLEFKDGHFIFYFSFFSQFQIFKIGVQLI